MGEMVEFPTGSPQAKGYLAQPAGGSGPGVVVIQEWWGLVDHIKDVTDRFAAAGFTAVAPDLYHGEVTTDPNKAGELMMSLDLERVRKDMAAAVDVARERSGNSRVGVVGFCMGGGLALMLACDRPDAVSAVVPFYSIIPWPNAEPDYSKMSAAMQGHYASLDSYFPPDAAKGLAEKLRSLGKEVEVFVYEGTDHAFFNDTRPEVYKPEAASQAWTRTIDFLRSRLA
ncbi:MAG: dienelactone hydrolase family protein [Actinobacteria bacterium]|jgi:carboxymethylenebutenolidase|nr:dienelactone hydrolase family protein [Actinomycetota bacterium]MCL6095633.1 dienelactone hydrolase family protein [Actinomycetota bacterium]